MRFEKTSGALVSFKSGARELVASELAPYFWRAPTDNDLGANLQERLAVWKTLADSAATRAVEHEREADGSITVTTRATMGNGALDFDVEYRVERSGAVRVFVRFDPKAPDLPMLPRLGMRFATPGALSQLEWFGRGPQETYADRRHAAPVGRYAGSVAAQLHDYVRPQETGNKVDVRWMAVRDDRGIGLLIMGAPHFSGGARNVFDEDIDHSPQRQLHSVDVEPRDVTVVHVDLKQMGLGGDDSWRSTAHPEHLIWPERYEYAFVLAPLAQGQDAGAAARQPCLRALASK